MKRTAPKSIDEYIAGFPSEVQVLLERIRSTIRKAAPDAEEKISYQIPAFTWRGKYLIYFAAFKTHIGLYPSPGNHPDFKEDLSPYASGKSTVKFPLDKPIPLGLIGRIVKFKVREAEKKAETKRRI